MEDVDEGPEQVVEVGFEPGVAEHTGEGLDDRGKPGADHLVVGQGAGIGLVLMRTVAVHLQFEDDAVGRRGGVIGLVAVVEGKVVGHGCLRRLWPRPSRPDSEPRPRPGGGRTEGRSAAEDGAAVAAASGAWQGVASRAGRGRGLLPRGPRHVRRLLADGDGPRAALAGGHPSGK